MKTASTILILLYDQWAPVLYPAVLRLVKNPMDAEDIVHETFLEAFDKQHQVRNPSSKGFWLRKIAINKALNFLRSQRINFNIEELADLSDQPEDEYWSGPDPERVLHEINLLPEGYKVVLCLYVFEDMSHAEIGDALGISPSTSRSQYSRALQLIRKQLSIRNQHG